MAGGSRLRVISGGSGGRTRRRRDTASFERDYTESYPMVYNYVFRRVANREVAEDIVSETFLRAARYYDRFDDSRAKFSTWVISIARNCITDYYRKDEITTPIEDVPEGAYSEDEHHDEQLGSIELAEQLLSTLDETERELVYLKYYEEKRNTEIAEILGMNTSTVSTKLSRAVAKMRASVA